MKGTIIAPKRFKNIAPNFVYTHFLGGPLFSSHHPVPAKWALASISYFNISEFSKLHNPTNI